MSTPKKDLLNIYFIAALFSGGRLFVGAISVLYVLSHGISISEFAIIKSLQVITFLTFDIPSGLFIKRFGFKISLVCTFFLSICGLSIYLIGNSLSHFLIAEFLTALSLCLYPTAYTDYMMDFLNRNTNILLEKLFHRSDMYSSIATLVCGGLGGYFYGSNKFIPYFIGIALQTLGLYLISKVKYQKKSIVSKSEFGIIKSLKSLCSILPNLNSQILIPVILLFIIQLTIQPLLHYWQPLFYEIDDKISGSFLGLVFISYSLCAIVLNYILSNLSKNSFFRSTGFIFQMLFGATLFYFITALSNNLILSYICFSLLQGFLFSSMTCISAVVNRNIADENRPIILKVISLFSRVGMLISFSCIQFFSGFKVHGLYLIAALFLSISIITIKLINTAFLKRNSPREVLIEQST